MLNKSQNLKSIQINSNNLMNFNNFKFKYLKTLSLETNFLNEFKNNSL